MLAVALGVTAYASGGAQDLVAQDSDTVTITTNPVDSEAPWTYDQAKSEAHGATVYVAGNSGENNRVAGVSNIALTVTGPGKLTFDYLVDTPEKDNQIMSFKRKYYGLIYQVGAPVSDSNYTAAKDQISGWVSRFSVHSDDWRTAEVQVADEGETTVYIAYYRSGDDSRDSTPTDENYVAISNVKFDSGKRTLTVDGANVTSDANSFSYAAGTSVELTATASDGGTFYGWTEGDALLSLDPTITVKVDDNRDIQAVFAPKGFYAARIDGKFYTNAQGGLAQALKDATDGDTVVMLASQTLSEDAEVKDGVFLLLPCMDNDVGYNEKGYAPDGTDKYLNSSHVSCYGTLTIGSGATLTVNGSVLVNAVVGTCGQTSGVNQGQISGGYAAIDLVGNIVIHNGGYLENFGEVNGGGQITVNSGGTLVDRYVLVHWRGGTQARDMYNENIYPMNEIDCHSITSDILIHSGGRFWGVVKVQADSKYTDTRFPQIDNKNGLIRLGQNATALKTYKDGRTTLTIDGGATFANSALTIVYNIELTTADYLFPVDGDIGFVLKNGAYEVANDFKLMPGCTVDVMGDASVKVDSGKRLVLYDEFNDKPNTDDTQYPSNCDPATLTLHGGATMEVYGTFAGRLTLADDVTDENYVQVRFDNGATVSATTYETNGLVASVPAGGSNTVELNFKAELWNADGTDSGVTVLAARTYRGTSAGWVRDTSVTSGLPGDANGDGKVDIDDLTIVLTHYQQVTSTGDLNDDGRVDIDDLTIVLSNYQTSLNS
jgi:hypothetical protein